MIIKRGQRVQLRESWSGYYKYPVPSGKVTEIVMGVIEVTFDDGRRLQLLKALVPKILETVTDKAEQGAK